MGENDSFYDIFFIYHPADIDKLERMAAQTRATGVAAYFNESEFGRTAEGIKRLKAGILRSYTIAFVMSPDSAQSQLCNELLQYAVGKGKRLLTLILNDDIEVEVHPAIAQNPYVFFRAADDLVTRVEELRAYLAADDSLKLHTELLVLAEDWRDRGRSPSLLLPPDRLAEARGWLATAPARHPKPSPLQLEYVHSSRRQSPRRGRARPLPIALGIVTVVALAVILLLLQRLIAGWQSGQVAGALTNEARRQVSIAAAEGTAASDSAVGLIDNIAATGALVRAAVAQNATQESITATAVARVTQTAQAEADTRATQMRATEVAQLERGDVARRLVLAGEEALNQGDIELAMALAWEAKSGLDNPRSAYRLMRRAGAAPRAKTIEDVALLRIQPAGEVFALLTSSRDELHIYDSETWTRTVTLSDHGGDITALVFSSGGERLISAADDGEIIIRDGLTGSAEHRLKRHSGAVTALALSADGNTLISAGGEPLLVAWDLERGEELAAYAIDGESSLGLIHDLLLTAGGERVIGWFKDGNKTVMPQWSGDTLELLSADSGGRVYRGYDAPSQIGYSGGGSLPAYPGDRNTGDLILWELATGSQRARLTDGFNWSFLSGDRLAAATDDLLFVSFYESLALVLVENSESGQGASLVDIEGARLRRRFEGELAAGLTSAIFLDEATILSATGDKRVLLWSSSDGRLLREIGRAADSIAELSASAAANLVSTLGEAGALQLWRLEAEAAEPLLKLGNAQPGTSISPSGDRILVVEADGIRLREVDSGATLVQLPAGLLSAAGSQFAVYADSRLSLYHLETGAEIQSWQWEAEAIVDLRLSPAGGQLLAFNEANELWLARVNAAAPQRLAGDTAQPRLVRFAPTGDAILTLQGERATLWDSELGLARAAYPLGTAERADVQAAFSADGSSIVFYLQLEDGLAALTRVDLADNAARRQTFVDVHKAALAEAGERLSLFYRDGRIQVIETSSGAVLHQFRTDVRADASDLRKLHYLSNSKTLVTAAGSELILWDAEAGVADQRLAQPQPLIDFSLSPDGRRILAAGEGGAYQLWQVESAAELLARVEADQPPRALTCAERERYLVAPLCE